MERIKHLLPGKAGDVGVTASDNRRFVEAVLYRYRAGIPRRAPCSSQGQACMGQLLSSLMVWEVKRHAWVGPSRIDDPRGARHWAAAQHTCIR
jgi:hypothetical protein